MILLDTDHLSILKYPSNPRSQGLLAKLAASPDQKIGTTIIAIEEQWRGWFAVIARSRDIRKQVNAYRELTSLHSFLDGWSVVSFDDDAASKFEQFRNDGIRIGSMDLKMACIAICNDALILSGNRKDFDQVPGLRVENWIG